VVDEALVAGDVPAEGVVEGDAPAVPASFEDCYREHHAAMVRVAFLLTGSRETAEDVVQDAFVKLHRAWRRVREPERYLHRIVVNGCRSHHRRAGRERAREMRAVAGDDGLAVLGAHELDDALAALPYRQRAAVVLRFYGDLSEAQTAEVLGCRAGTVGSLVHRALEQLRRTVEP
jgi:RNA polymerase sigma-70 factor (sigma-E family)